MFRKILLPIDLASDGHERAVAVAVDEARRHGAELHVVSVLPDLGLPQVGDHFRPGWEREALHELGERLKDWVARNLPADQPVRPHVMHGRTYDEILRAARTLGVDLIVIAAHRPGLADYLLGSTAARVVRHAPCSVFVVREAA
ncbi:MAG: universal stress protein [Alphaproteobacteria bacterium]|nr:MAG: universal stress protein [Alphaproteobacteria bacterium]